ncbi:hypothetical protein A2960_03540 [Candidatus Gottesmanbacteria bacterium RIFCSPLOWO2_01_FULL_39_12b]|uniref:Methyltransferase type 11 domain-containing protein n=1 Tax=Candidatus Gottesmanbacteria bacterium RIFCSPLOWO2_01_FULL_39_12b TaxID=1798388 RepID=A0A1F6ANV8_9BACT|nr:MAG: hypothetical protein A2960_03540 [Candidatus Gottesmanbacteria bacterium RIFCSPLOWO2_01_FULL_39_12b]
MRLTKIKFFDLFYRAYHAWPHVYNGVTQLISIGQWEKWQDRVFEDINGKNILEVGVGPGKLLLRIAKKGYRVTGIELRRGMAYEARRRVKEAGFDIDILNQSIYHLPFKDEVFDCIVLTFILSEIVHLEKAIIELKRVLKPGGKVIIIAGGMPQDRNLIARFIFKIVESHTTLRLERNNKAYFEDYGFKVTREDFGPFNLVNKIIAIK